MKRRLLATILAVVSSFGAIAVLGCAEEIYRDHEGHPYHHRHWHNEEVYQHEDGRWYAHRREGWVVVEVRD